MEAEVFNLIITFYLIACARVVVHSFERVTNEAEELVETVNYNNANAKLKVCTFKRSNACCSNFQYKPGNWGNIVLCAARNRSASELIRLTTKIKKCFPAYI